jgi:hypothetical protein
MRTSNIIAAGILLTLGVGAWFYFGRSSVARRESSSPSRETNINKMLQEGVKNNDLVDNRPNSQSACGKDSASNAIETAMHVSEVSPVQSVCEVRPNEDVDFSNGGTKMETTGEKTFEVGLTDAEMQIYIRIAADELTRMQVPIAGRNPVVTANENEVTVTYEPPKGARAGAFIIKIDKITKEVKDSKIWR